MSRRFSLMWRGSRILVVMLLQIGQPSVAKNEINQITAEADWGGSEQMVHRLTRSLRQQGRLSIPHDAINLRSSYLSASNFWLDGTTALTVLKRLQSDHPLLKRLQVATNEFVLSGEDKNTHCIVRLKSAEALRLAVMVSCATLSQDQIKPIFPHPVLSVQWSWQEHYPTQSVHQQVVEIHGDRKKAHTLIQRSLNEAGWAVTATEQGLTATQKGRYLLLSYVEDKRWNNAAYLIEIQTVEKRLIPLTP